MHKVVSSTPRPELRPFVRAYAQRELRDMPDLAQPVVASLEQVLQFDFGSLLTIDYVNGKSESASPISVVGAHTSQRAFIRFSPNVESFAVFFQPLGLSRLFHLPNPELVDRAYNGGDLLGNDVRELWLELAEAPSFEARVQLVEAFLLKRASSARPETPIMAAATHIFRKHGVLRVSEVAERQPLGFRHFERKFSAEIGMNPKLFARITRFQTALDHKINAPERAWVKIAHHLGYHDQMHMIRDFHKLGRSSPQHVLKNLGDGRPPALAIPDPISQSLLG